MKYLITLGFGVAILAALDEGVSLIGPAPANTDNAHVAYWRKLDSVRSAVPVSINTAAVDSNIITVVINKYPIRFTGSITPPNRQHVDTWTGAAWANTSAEFQRDGERLTGEIELGDRSFRVVRYADGAGVLAELKPASERKYRHRPSHDTD